MRNDSQSCHTCACGSWERHRDNGKQEFWQDIVTEYLERLKQSVEVEQVGVVGSEMVESSMMYQGNRYSKMAVAGHSAALS